MAEEIVQLYSITKCVPNFDKGIFAPYKKQLENLFTDRKKFAVSFDLVGCMDKVANAIRRTIMGELDIKALTFDPTIIQTNVDFLIIDELLDRIHYLPISQTTPLDTVFSINAVNKGSEIQTLYSESITSNKSENEDVISKRFRLAELRTGNYLHIPKITVESGKGSEHSRFSLSCDYTFDNTDYMDASIINSKGNRIRKRILVSELFDLLHQKSKSNKSSKNTRADRLMLLGKKILVIPNKDYEKLIDEDERVKIDLAKYDEILVNQDSNIKPEDFLQERSSFMSESSEFRMCFWISNQIAPEDLIPMTCDNLITRLNNILTAMHSLKGSIGAYDSIRVRSEPVNILHKEEMTTVDLWCLDIMNETHTIGELLVKQIYLLDPDIPFVKKHMDHPKDNQVTIQILHPDSLKLCINALETCIEDFVKIKNAALKLIPSNNYKISEPVSEKSKSKAKK